MFPLLQYALSQSADNYMVHYTDPAKYNDVVSFPVKWNNQGEKKSPTSQAEVPSAPTA
jgi:hypothetical protein